MTYSQVTVEMVSKVKHPRSSPASQPEEVIQVSLEHKRRITNLMQSSCDTERLHVFTCCQIYSLKVEQPHVHFQRSETDVTQTCL